MQANYPALTYSLSALQETELMRYPENAPPDPDLPYSESMHQMLTLSMWMSIIIGIMLFVAGRHGKVLWLKTWSIGLIICSVIYLTGDALQLL